MNSNTLPIDAHIQIPNLEIERIWKFFNYERGIECSEPNIRDVVTEWWHIYIEFTSKQIYDVLTSTEKRSEFEKLLKKHVKKAEKSAELTSAAIPYPTLFDMEPSKFSGMLKPSAPKIEQLIVYLAYRKKGVFPTVLNKLLFYSDFSSFYGRQVGISGYEYHKMDHGPAIPVYEDILRNMEKKGKIRLKPITSKGQRATVVIAPKDFDIRKLSLSKIERNIAEWVVETYGNLSTNEIIQRSHAEDAWWNQEYGATLDYLDAATLNIKPPKELFD